MALWHLAWTATAALLLLGLTAAVIALRGRRVNDHPICRRCRFDLSGLYPAAAACPECGSELVGPCAVRHGQRRTRRGVLALGTCASIVAIAVGGTLVWSSATAFDWNTIKPDRLLVWEATRGPSPSAAVLAELHRRGQPGDLPERRLAALARHAAAHQDNPAWTWHPLFETAFISAWERRLIGDADALRYAMALDPPRIKLEGISRGAGTGLLSAWAAYIDGGRGPLSSILTVDYTLENVTLGNRVTPHPRDLIAGESNRHGLANVIVFGEVIDPRTARGPLVATWRARALSRAGDRAGETLGEWTITLETNFVDLLGERDRGGTGTPPP